MNQHPLEQIRHAAHLWRKNHPDHATRGHVIVSTQQTSGMAFAFGWTICEPIACHFARGNYAVSVKDEVMLAAGGTAASAGRWDILHEDVIRPEEPEPAFPFPSGHPPLASQRFQERITSTRPAA